MKKTVYLTFDDGPDLNTPTILKILKKYKVKATFFNLGSQAEKHPDLVRMILEGGHTLGNHTYSHNPVFYEDPVKFLEEVKKTNELERTVTGIDPEKIFRFPFGSEKVPLECINALEEEGYSYVDWNVYLQDGSRNPSSEAAFEAVIKGLKTCEGSPVILTHMERPEKTGPLQALEPILRELLSQGYIFKRITPDDRLVRFKT